MTSGVTNGYATFGGFKLLDPGPLMEYAQQEGTPTEFWGRVNSFRCPRGREPGVGYFLMRRGDIYTTANGGISSATINGKMNPEAAQSFKVYTDSTNTPSLTIPTLYVTRGLQMTRQAYPGDDDTAYLLEVMDKRRIFQLTNRADAFNVHDNLSTVSNSTSWTSLFSSLWSGLPSSIRGTVPSLPYTPHGEPEEIKFYGDNAWDAINAALWQLACTVAYDPVLDTFSFVRIGETQTGLTTALAALAANNDRLLFDYAPISPRTANLPQTYTLYHPRRQKHVGAGIYDQTPWFEPDATTLNTFGGTITGTKLPIFNTLRALYNGSGSVENSSAISARATDLATKYGTATSSINNRLRKHYSGTQTSIMPGSEIAEVAWRDYGDGSGWQTEIIRGPRDERKPAAMDVGCFGAADTAPAPEALPQLTAMVRIEGSDTLEEPADIENSGATQTNGIIAGRAWAWNPDTDGFAGPTFRIPADNDCWIICDRRATAFNKTQYYVGRLFGYYDPDPGGGGTDERPIYAIGDFPKIWYGKVNASLNVEIYRSTTTPSSVATGIVVTPNESHGFIDDIEENDEVIIQWVGDGNTSKPWNITANITRIERIEGGRHLGRLDANLAPATTGTVSLYNSSGSDTGTNVTANSLFVMEELLSNTYVWLEKFNGTWYVVSPTRPAP